MNRSKQKSNPSVLLPIAFFFLGGIAGATLVIKDYLTRGSYKPQSKPTKQKTIQQLVIVGGLLLFLRVAIEGFAADLIIPGASWANELFPTFTQIVLGLTLGSRYLHKHNIYFTSKEFWKDQNMSFKDLEKIDPKTLLKQDPNTSSIALDPMATTASNSAAPTSTYSQSQSQSAIVVDQSGDAWRVKIIAIAVIALVMVLGYWYLASNPELVTKQAEQFLNSLEINFLSGI